MATDADVRIEPLTLERAPEAAAALTRSFSAEPINATMFDFADEDTVRRYRYAMGRQLRVAIEAGHPPFIALLDGAVVGVAAVSRYSFSTVVRSIRAWLPMMPRFRRSAFGVVMAAMPSKKADKPYLSLEALGVVPEAEGRGIGRALLEATTQRCADADDCRGVYLQTAGERSKRIYAAAGFELLEERTGGELTVAHMFWRRDRDGDEPG